MAWSKSRLFAQARAAIGLRPNAGASRSCSRPALASESSRRQLMKIAPAIALTGHRNL